jgi:parvulin-like peptidyl-prolyl isomerase
MTFLIAALTLIGQDPILPATPDASKVVITVNGHPITAKEVQAYLWDWNAVQVGTALTTFEIIHQEAAKQGVSVTKDEIKKKIDSMLTDAMSRDPKKPTREQFIKDHQVHLSQAELGIKAQLELDKIAEKSFKAADFIRVATIVIRPKSPSADDVQASITKGNAAYASLQKGDSWEKVLPAFASEPQSIQNNGELGWVLLSEFPAPTRTEVGTLKIGGYSKPVQTPNGIQIFKLEARGKDVPATELDQVKARYVQSAEQEIVTKLKANAKITTSY